jgi:hypothetical protein
LTAQTSVNKYGILKIQRRAMKGALRFIVLESHSQLLISTPQALLGLLIHWQTVEIASALRRQAVEIPF